MRSALNIINLSTFSAFVTMLLISCSSPTSADEEGLSVKFGESAKSLHVPVGGDEVFIYPAFEDYADMLFNVCDALGLTIDSGDCQILPMNGDLGGNAIATIIDDNRVIVYDRNLSPLIGYDGAMGVIAHEVGHHYCGHLSHDSPNPSDELEADQFVGVVFRRMKLSLDQALAMTTILDERPSTSHPARSDRERAISTGWRKPDISLACEHAD